MGPRSVMIGNKEEVVMPPRISYGFQFASLLLFSVLASGCGGEKLVRVTGTATRHGKPVPNLVINFTPDKGLRSFAKTDQDGSFTMIYTNGQEGVVMGTHKVWVQLQTTGSKEDKEHKKLLARQQSDPEMAQILKKYGKADTTPLTVEAKEDREINLALD
jgi:hypothetical protein